MSRLTYHRSDQTPPLKFGFDELASLPARDQVPNVEALVAGKRGGAVRLRAILGEPMNDMQFVHVESSDGSFTANVPIADALRDGLVLYEFDGGPLPERHGGPFRLLFIDGRDCSVNVKDLGVVELADSPGSHTAKCADDPSE